MKIKKTKVYNEEKLQDIAWSKNVKERDGHQCVICGDGLKPNAHHIIVREVRETRHDLNNGITLCVKHHKFSRVISAHNNSFVFFCWLEKNRPEQFNYLKQLSLKLL